MSKDPIESASKGATEGTLEWTKQQVLDLLKQLQNRKLAFIKDSDNIQLVKDERASSEFVLLSQWVPKGQYSVLVQMGLALREIADDQTRVLDLVNKIRGKYGLKGLHVSEFTEVGMTKQLLGHLVEIYHDPMMVAKWLNYFFEHIEDLVVWVRKDDNPPTIARIVMTRIEAMPSHLMILFGSGFAKDPLLKALRLVKADPRDYYIEVHPLYLQTIAFIFTPEMKAKVSHWSDTFVTRS